ncbi:uncharacterized protein EV420DRAFT_604727 [Desarmillaria tabescens]|uniref:MYND-type domain-containing protein n=1 Tax=Armillaria tabescens TaxID=1929756 RepID=A0AA39K418_ARMTA|nr:uncharacterized protein EV420DRAFT_604727 [Desarmillaria tabescens]KAK0454191.1 hypothetical protein EV420DRAFT_604727 [Desarmillaria tabescens]
MSIPPHARLAAEIPLISSCSELVMIEFSSSRIQTFREVLFKDERLIIEEEGSSAFEKWYRHAASVHQRRTVAWKKGRPFHPQNLFFRTVDTGRLLPMSLASFRVQMYATKDRWDTLEQQGVKERWSTYAVLELMHRILIFRNIHDYGGDIPIICIKWEKEFVDLAMDYWIELSANKWTKEEREAKFCKIARDSHGLSPSFYELDLCVRALLLDEAVGYVPPFIVIVEMGYDIMARTLFTCPSHVPSPSLLESLPNVCGSRRCTDSDCTGLWRTERPRSLHHPSPMVRKPQRYDDRVVCNLWGCEVQMQKDVITGRMTLKRCQKCKEVLYCSREHQFLDWNVHKRVCEPAQA